LFIGPWDQSANWSVEGMGGTFRFLQRVWTLVQENLESKTAPDEAQLRIIHRAIKRVSDDLHQMGFNTAIAALMETVNELYKYKTQKEVSKEMLLTLLQLLAPFAPHMTEELWQQLGEKNSVHKSTWPVHDEKHLIEESMVIVVQVNGKLRASIEVATDSSEEQVIAAAKSNEKVAGHLAGHDIKKTVYVAGKLLNFVV
jgi:leucyl-tRNA synthetase